MCFSHSNFSLRGCHSNNAFALATLAATPRHDAKSSVARRSSGRTPSRCFVPLLSVSILTLGHDHVSMKLSLSGNYKKVMNFLCLEERQNSGSCAKQSFIDFLLCFDAVYTEAGEGAKLLGVSFFDADLAGVDLPDVDLRGADF